MADTKARVNQDTAWTSTGTSDTLTCDDLAPGIRYGVQIDTNGFDIADATVVATTKAGATVTVDVSAIAGESALIGEGYSVSKVVLSGIAAGSYTVHFSQ